MGKAKTRHAYGLEFTTKDLQIASGRTRAAIHTLISEEHGVMEDVCRKLGFENAEQLGRALEIVRAEESTTDAETEKAVETICAILGYGEEDAEMKEEKKTEETTVRAAEKDAMVRLMDGYEAAIDAMDRLTDALRAVDGDESQLVLNYEQLHGVLEAAMAERFSEWIVIDWAATRARMRG